MKLFTLVLFLLFAAQLRAEPAPQQVNEKASVSPYLVAVLSAAFVAGLVMRRPHRVIPVENEDY